MAQTTQERKIRKAERIVVLELEIELAFENLERAETEEEKRELHKVITEKMTTKRKISNNYKRS